MLSLALDEKKVGDEILPPGERDVSRVLSLRDVADPCFRLGTLPIYFFISSPPLSNTYREFWITRE